MQKNLAMVTRGNSRSNPRQLSFYLLDQKDNENIRILDVDGYREPDAAMLHRAVFMMGVSAELSKGEKGLYHAQINPAIGEDARMTDDDWVQASNIMGRHLGLANQSRAIVLHTKKGRTHAHVVWERFDHEKGKLVSDSFSRLAQDRARKEMELVFEQKRTPHRNKHRPELKASLTELWQKTDTGAKFIREAKRKGYIISTGSGRSPFMVVDENGRSYDLTRQLKDVRLKEVRQRLRNETLIGEKEAITLARKSANDAQETGGKGKQKTTLTPKTKHMQEEIADNKEQMAANDNQKGHEAKRQFKENTTDTTKQPEKEQQASTKQQFRQNKPDATGQKMTEQKFSENKADTTQSDREKERERRKEEFKKRMQQEPKPSRDRGIDMD
ncbi:MAG TPA: relaxase/mobilization nuclease domain-containing protein [Flavisolibacter sp.]